MSADETQDDQTPPDAPVLNYLSPAREIRFIILRKFSSPVEANLARLRLESEGIRVQLAGEIREAALGAYGAISNGVELLVLESELETALRILDEVAARRSQRLATEGIATQGFAVIHDAEQDSTPAWGSPDRAVPALPITPENPAEKDPAPNWLRKSVIGFWVFIAISIAVIFVVLIYLFGGPPK